MPDNELLMQLQEYIDNHIKTSQMIISEVSETRKSFLPRKQLPQIAHTDLKDFIRTKQKQSSRETLFSFIDNKKKSDSEVYKKAGIDRRHFSKIRSISDYNPGKNTVIALVLSLELSRKEADKLLCSAGYALSGNDIFDLVIQFFLEKQIQDIDEVTSSLH